MSVETNRSFIIAPCVVGLSMVNPTTTAIEFAPPFSAINATWNPTEADREIQFGIIGQLSNLSVHVKTFVADVNPTLRTRINTADANQIVTLTATGMFQDTSNIDELTAVIDEFTFEFDHVTGSTTACVLDSIVCKLVIQS